MSPMAAMPSWSRSTSRAKSWPTRPTSSIPGGATASSELFLVTERPSDEETAALNSRRPGGQPRLFRCALGRPRAELGLLEKLRAARYHRLRPGTQHSSLFPSYLTPGIGPAIAHNLRAFKILITNLQGDADMADSSAVEIIERAVYYLREKGRLSLPTPCSDHALPD